MIRHFVAVALLLSLSACSFVFPPRPAPVPAPPPTPTPVPGPPPTPAPVPAPPLPGPPPVTPPPVAITPVFRAADFAALPGWSDDNLAEAWPALQRSCGAVVGQPAWAAVCQAVNTVNGGDAAAVRSFLEANFLPYQILQSDGTETGLVTGYYEPLLRGSRVPGATYRYAVHAPPPDLITVDLAAVYPELKNLRLRGRVVGNKLVPYFTRAEIESGLAAVRGRELLWVGDAVELFFLQIQGSGRVQLDSGEMLRLGYADQNGHPYRSIGKLLVDRGELTIDKASMQGIQDWAGRNPDKLPELLNSNPSYVFFRELPYNGGNGPPGALGVPLTGGRSIAVDPRVVPLGAPVFLATTWPNSPQPLNRLVAAQDTGGAIRGNVRADFFWGFGPEAGKLAGAMKQQGRMWVLLPKDYPLPAAALSAPGLRPADNPPGYAPAP